MVNLYCSAIVVVVVVVVVVAVVVVVVVVGLCTCGTSCHNGSGLQLGTSIHNRNNNRLADSCFSVLVPARGIPKVASARLLGQFSWPWMNSLVIWRSATLWRVERQNWTKCSKVDQLSNCQTFIASASIVSHEARSFNPAVLAVWRLVQPFIVWLSSSYWAARNSRLWSIR